MSGPIGFILLGILVPALVSGAVLLVAGRSLRRGEYRSEASRWSVPLGLALGVFAGVVGIRGWPKFPPNEVTLWLPYLAIAVVPYLWIEGRWIHRSGVRWMARLIVVVAILTLLLLPRVRYASSPVWMALGFLGIGVLVWGTWLSIAGMDKMSGGWGPHPVAILVLSIAGSLVLGLSGSLWLGQLGGVATAALGMQWMIHGWKPIRGWTHRASGVLLVMLPGLWIVGWQYASVHPLSGVFLLLGLNVAWVVRLRMFRGVPPFKAALIQMVVCGVCGVGAALVAYSTSPSLYY